MVLGIPIDTSVYKPITYFPKDILSTILRAISLRGNRELDEKKYYKNYTATESSLPKEINYRFFKPDSEEDLFFNSLRFVGQMEDDIDFVYAFSIIYNNWASFCYLVSKFNYEYKNLIKYLLYLINYEGYNSTDAINDLRDYMDMSSEIIKACKKDMKVEKYPHFLKSRHQTVMVNYRVMKEKEKEIFFSSQYDGSLEYSYKNYCIIEPKTSIDVLNEAYKMHNCVASYVGKIINGITKIVFMREKDCPEESLVTVEIRNGHLCQAYQKCNEKVTKEQFEFLKKYTQEKDLILDLI